MPAPCVPSPEMPARRFPGRPGFSLLLGVVLVFSLLPALPAGGVTAEEETNIRVFRDASPAVVNITTTVLIRDFFAVYPQEGSGSGSLIDARGYVVTNHHVVQAADRVSVSLTDGTRYEARLVGSDEDRDVAVLQLLGTEGRTFPTLTFGGSADLRVGQKVYAIGNPFGLHSTLTSGIVSALGRPIRTARNHLMSDVIQTDTPINPGNSGGPLLDTRGFMIGLNTAIFSPSGGSVGIGFAVPVDTIRPIVEDILTYGRVRKAWLGIVAVPLWDELALALDLPVSAGLLISEVVPGGPADVAGVQGGASKVWLGRTGISVGGDIIVEVDGAEVTSMDSLRRVLSDHVPGDMVPVKVLRNGETSLLSVKLADMPRFPAPGEAAP